MGTETAPYDLAVIGGGIAGGAVARDAALRGIRVVLLEKDRFGSGTSSKSSKLIHGGFRYLELAWESLRVGDAGHFIKNLRFVFSSLRESRLLHRIAPDLVAPHPLWIPIYSPGKRSKLSIFLGALVYGILAEMTGNLRSPSFYWTPRSLLKEIPMLGPAGLSGGVKIWDHLTDDLALTEAVIASARKNGARCDDLSEVISYRHDPARNVYVLRVRRQGVEQEVLSRKIVNATGAWVDDLRERSGENEEKFVYPVSGCHVNVKPFLPHSVLLEAEDGRFFFVIHRGSSARIGTTERLVKSPDDIRATPEEVDYLLDSVNKYFPDVKLTKNDILSTDAGIRPLAKPAYTTDANKISREHEIRVSPSGAVHLLGVKLTDHRRAAEDVVNRLVPSLLQFNPKIERKSRTAKTPL